MQQHWRDTRLLRFNGALHLHRDTLGLLSQFGRVAGQRPPLPRHGLFFPHRLRRRRLRRSACGGRRALNPARVCIGGPVVRCSRVGRKPRLNHHLRTLLYHWNRVPLSYSTAWDRSRRQVKHTPDGRGEGFERL